MRGAQLLGALLALVGMLQVTLSLKIAAFNIRTFGDSKMSNTTVSSYIVQVRHLFVTRGAREPQQTCLWGLAAVTNPTQHSPVLRS